VSSELELPTLRPGKSIALIALGMGVYFLYLYHLGFQEIIRALGNVNLAIFSLGILLALVGVLGDSLAWQEIAKKFDYNVPIWDIFLIYMSCIFMNNLIPSGSFSGETTRVYFLDKIAGNSRIDRSSATVAATRIITAIPFIVGTIVGLAYLACLGACNMFRHNCNSVLSEYRLLRSLLCGWLAGKDYLPPYRSYRKDFSHSHRPWDV